MRRRRLIHRPSKIQIQVDYLDAHLECALCFHPVQVICEDGSAFNSFVEKYFEFAAYFPASIKKLQA